MLVDVTKCVSCWWCYAACKNYNKLPETYMPDPAQPPLLTPRCWTTLTPILRDGGWHSRKHACNHCTEAACVDVCPTAALTHNELGFVQYDKNKCSGCGYCVEFCPFGIPKLEGNTITGAAFMDKCTFCQDRVVKGLTTACADACPTGAVIFGRRAELLEDARSRVAELRQASVNAVLYGDKELGGLHVMYVLDDTPDIYGLPAEPEISTPTTVRHVLRWVGAGAAVLAVLTLGLNYLISRARIARGEKK